ncbi:MAG: hypothetical protein ABFS23_06920 [Pseudomonadota bacterium]
MTLSWFTGFSRFRRTGLRTFVLLSFAWLSHPPVLAQDLMPGASTGSMAAPWGAQSGMSQPPFPSNDWSFAPPGYSRSPLEPAPPLHDRQRPYAAGPAPGYANRDRDSYEPDLTGNWQGGGGEKVEIRGNRARIWGGPYESCDCLFFIVGDRLIAYSRDTDVVRKFQFKGGRDRFWLIDDQGNLMSFWRVR